MNLNTNTLKFLPEEICEIKSLEILDLGNNNLSDLPKNIFRLVNLKELVLGISYVKNFNQIMELDKKFNHFHNTDCIGELKSLEKVDLRKFYFHSAVNWFHKLN